MRPKPAGRHADGIYLHHESAGTGGDEDPRWEPVDEPTSWYVTDEQARAVRCPLPQVMLFRPLHGYDRTAPTMVDIFSARRGFPSAQAQRITGQDGGFTSTSTPANNWW